MLRNLGGWEVIVILVVVLLLFGATRLPKLARSIGESAKELRAGMSEDEAEEGASAGTKAEAATDGKEEQPS